MQRLGLSSIIAGVNHVESMLREYPQRSADHLRLVEEMCNVKLPNNLDESNKLTAVRAGISSQTRTIDADERMLR